MVLPQPRLSKTGVAWLLGCSVAEVTRLVNAEAFGGYALRDDGNGWEPHRGTSGIDLVFVVEEIIAFRTERRRSHSDAPEGNVADLPVCPMPSLGAVAAAALLEISEPTVRWQVTNEKLPAYVLNRQGTTWVPAGSPEATPRATLLFLPEDLEAAKAKRKPTQTTEAQLTSEEQRVIQEVYASLAGSGKVTRLALCTALHEQRGWSLQRTNYNKVSTWLSSQKQSEK